MSQDCELEIVGNTTLSRGPFYSRGQDPVSDTQRLVETFNLLVGHTGCVGVLSIRSCDVYRAPGWDPRDSALSTVLEQFREVRSSGVTLRIPKSGDCGNGLSGVIQWPAVDGPDAIGIRVVFQDLYCVSYLGSGTRLPGSFTQYPIPSAGTRLPW